jgi:PAS domain S-box-containing protein
MSFKQLLKGTLGEQKMRAAADRPAVSAAPRAPASERAGQASASVLYLAGDARETRMLPGGFSYDHPHLALDLSLDINEARPRLAQPGRYQALVIGWSVPSSEAASLVRFVRALGSTIAIVAIGDHSLDALREAGADQCVQKSSTLIAQLPTAIEDALQQRAGRVAPSNAASQPTSIAPPEPVAEKVADIQPRKPVDPASSAKTLRVAYSGDIEPVKAALGGEPPALQMVSLTQALRDSDVRPQGSPVPFDVIVIDHGASGRQTATTLADVRARSLDVPVVLAFDPREERTSALQAFGAGGVDEFIAKTPDWPSRLAVKLETVCARHQQQRELASLRVKESRLRALVDRLPACVVRLSPEGVVLATNAVAMSLLGASQPNQLLRKPFDTLVGADARDGWTAFVGRVCGGEQRSFEFPLTALDGVSRTIEAVAVPSAAEAGGSASVLMVLRDVSDRKRLESALEEAIRRAPIVDAADAAPEPVAAVADTPVPMAPATATPPDARVLRDLETDLHQIADRARSTVDELGTLLREVATQHDAAFTRQVDAYARIKTEQLEHWRSYEAFVQTAAHGIIRVALDDTIQMVNQAFAAMLGYESPAAVLDGAPSIAQFTDARRWRLAVDQWRGGSTEPVENHWRRRDGAIGALRLHGRLVSNAAGDGESFEVVVEDVGAQRALESQLRRARRWEDAARVTSGIAADLSHLVSSIKDATERLLSEAPTDGAARAHADTLQQTLSRALALSRQLVAFGRKEARDPRAFDLNDAVRALEHVMRRVIDEYIELSLELGDAVGTVDGSQPALEEALVHLIVAAGGALPAGGELRISTAARDVEAIDATDGLEPGRYAVLSIAASGWGLDADIHDRLSAATPSTGAQLRLASARRNIAAMGGHVGVAGDPGSSLIFNVYVPRAGGAGAFESEDFASEVAVMPSSNNASPETGSVEM